MAVNLQVQPAADVVIREVEEGNEIRAVEELQKEVWGLPDLDVVPFTQLIAAKAAGGVLIGAFNNGALVGFAYGFVGCENGQMTHHSHMLAVKPAYRNLSLGYKLKRAQRDLVLAQGITEMTWTFDPLQSLNAYFNFGRLGVLSDRYLVDFYGTDAASFLHRNGTDRLWVSWPLASRRVVERLETSAEEADVRPMIKLVESGDNNTPLSSDIELKNAGDHVSIEIPSDINGLGQRDPDLAAAWRIATRTAFAEAFSVGYVAVDFIRGAKSGSYILSRRISEDSLRQPGG
jgi:predicted GNAT superfamily acetyltransferase